MDVIVLLNHVKLYDDVVVKYHEMNIDRIKYQIDNYNLDIDVQSNVDAF